MHADLADRGRDLVAQGQHDSPRMLDRLAVCAYFREQRALVARRGSCSGGCGSVQFIPHTRGHLVCPHTFEPCPSVRLRLIVDLYSRIFQR